MTTPAVLDGRAAARDLQPLIACRLLRALAFGFSSVLIAGGERMPETLSPNRT